MIGGDLRTASRFGGGGIGMPETGRNEASSDWIDLLSRSSRPARRIPRGPEEKIAWKVAFSGLTVVEGKPYGECRMIVPYVDFRQSMDVLKALPRSEKTHHEPGYSAFRVWTEQYRFDERDYDGYISKSFERLSGFGNRALFGEIRTPRRREAFLMNDMAEKLLVKRCEFAGVDFQPEERAFI